VEENKMEFLGIVVIVGIIVWFAKRWFLKKEAAIIAKNNAVWDLAKRDLQAFEEKAAAAAAEVVDAVEKKAEEAVVEVEKKIEEAVVAEIENVKTKIVGKKVKK
jgi:hypothetical protein